MKYFGTLIILAILFLISETTLYAQLSYAEGGPSVEDPGLEVDIELRRYIDAVNGKDANDGKTQATAWKTLSKVNSSISTFLPGLHILFKRGQSWTGTLGGKHNPSGIENERIVYGAYGKLTDARPKLDNNVYTASYYMVRDLQAGRFTVTKYHHTIFYNNICFGGYNNGIMTLGGSHHNTIIGNLVYDVDNNDPISVHGSGNLFTKSHHWVIDNVVVGNDGMEDGIDLAMGNYIASGEPLEGDVKIVYNRVQMTSVPGLSKKTGKGLFQIIVAHDGQYHWVVGNTVSGGSNSGISLQPNQSNIRVSGNIIFKGNLTSACSFSSPGTIAKNNTIYDYSGNTIPVNLRSSNSVFSNNIILRPDGGYWVEIGVNPIKMDYNWWGHSDSPIISGKSLSDWQTDTGFDINSNAGLVSGITEPQDNAYSHDPRNWTDEAFLSQFIPSSEFSGLEGTIPGAFDKNGKRLGMEILPIYNSDLENGGLGWEGPPLVQQRLRELGISWGEPLLAKYPTPKDKSTNVSLESNLSWEAGDSTISHDLYFGVKPDSLIFISNQNETSFNPSSLTYETVYYWRVDQVTNDSTLTGNIWSFTTEEEPIAPTLAVSPSPSNQSNDIRTSIIMYWELGKRTRSSKIYFGTSNPPSFVASVEENNYNPGVLVLNTKYYWRVDGVNEWGETEGTVWEFTTQSVPDLPNGWASLDIGKVNINGEDGYENNSFTITASGSGVKDNSDQFRYVFHNLNGNGEIVARIASIENATSNTLAGVMIREKLDTISNYHLAGFYLSSGVKAQWRSFEGGTTSIKNGSITTTPNWLKVQRVSDFLISSESIDGQKWKTLKTEKITMQSDVQLGLFVTSGDNDSLSTVVFDNVSMNGILVSVEDEEKSIDLIPSEFTISNYPNPFNPITTIKYSIPNIEGNKNIRSVEIKIYDIMGSLVTDLVSGKKNAGNHNVIWDGKNNQGISVSSGIYFYRVQLDDQIKTAKMLLMK